MINGQWYEFDDQYVTEVHETVVQSAEAYVLFYRWDPGQAVVVGLGLAKEQTGDLGAWMCVEASGAWEGPRPGQLGFQFVRKNLLAEGKVGNPGS